MSRREAIGRSAAEAAFDAVIGLGRSVRYEVRNPHYFEDAKEHLSSGTLDNKSSLIILANVSGRSEIIVLADVIARNITDLSMVSALTSVEFLDSKRNRFTSALIRRASEARGFRIFPVVPPDRSHVYEESSDALGGRKPNRFTGESLVRAVEMLKNPGQVLVISPEQIEGSEPDTEEKSQQLSRAYEGLDIILRHSRTTSLILPVTLRSIDRKPKSRLVPKPPIPKLIVTPGPIFSHESVQDEYQRVFEETRGKPMIGMNDLIMMRLAELLPAKNQGYYRPFLANA